MLNVSPALRLELFRKPSVTRPARVKGKDAGLVACDLLDQLRAYAVALVRFLDVDVMQVRGNNELAFLVAARLGGTAASPADEAIAIAFQSRQHDPIVP